MSFTHESFQSLPSLPQNKVGLKKKDACLLSVRHSKHSGFSMSENWKKVQYYLGILFDMDFHLLYSKLGKTDRDI